MFDALLKSKFYSKCKSEIKLTKMRIEIIMRKRKAMQKFLRNDVADLLKNGLDSNAYGRVEGLYIEQNLSSCYQFVEQSCLHILSQLSSMYKQRECPQECKEAIASLMFAAARFADLPELRELRSLFSERYGNCVEPYVNTEFVKKLKADPPTKEMKLQLMQEIAHESGLEWNSKALEQKLYNPPPSVQDWSQNVNEDRNYKSPEKSHFYHRETTLQEPDLSQNVNKDRNYESPKKSHFYRGETKLQDPQEAEKKDFDNNQTEVIKKKEDSNLGNRLPFKSRAEVAKKPEENRRASPCWSSNTSSSSESITSPEYSTGPDDSASEDHIVKERKFYGFRSMAPPYIITDSSKNGTSSGASSGSGTEEDIIGSKHKDDNQANNTKPIPRSMRRRPVKPVPRSHEKNEIPKSPKGESCDDDDRDEQEKKMDKLLLHYSRKPSNIPSGSITKNNGGREGRAPARAASLPAEPVATPVAKGFARAVSSQVDSSLSSPLGHVHPKLPDYDDFVARLAAFRAGS